MMKRQLSLLESFSKKPKSSKLNLEPEESPDSESLNPSQNRSTELNDVSTVSMENDDGDELQDTLDCVVQQDPLLEPNSVACSSGIHLKSPNDVASNAFDSPKQPCITFPLRLFGNGQNARKRCFNSAWYQQYTWLEYSVERDAAYCYPCRIFTQRRHHGKESTFTVNGFHNWKNASGKKGVLESHDKCSSHKDAMVSWKQFITNSKKEATIDRQVDSSHKKQIESNRHYIKTVAEVILKCCQQDMALRGHRECNTSHNRGNFLEWMELVANHDDIIKKKLQSGPHHALYTSPEIQNNILAIMADLVRNKITSPIKESQMFSLLVDETKDISKVEQMAIVLRYVDKDTATIHERFLTYHPAHDLTAEGLTAYIQECLSKQGLDPKWIVAQSYDGAAVMSGKCSGVQARIKQVAPQAEYIHCKAHCLNLCLVDCVKSNEVASRFFALLNLLYTFISSSKSHSIFMHQQSILYPQKQPKQLQRPSETRWASRHGAINALLNTYDAVLATLTEIRSGKDAEKATEACGILAQVSTFQFIICLVVFEKLLSCSKSLSDALQSSNLDLLKATELISATIETLTEYRSDSHWNRFHSYSKEVAELHKISIGTEKRMHRPSSRYKAHIIWETTGSSCGQDNLKINFYYPILDAFLAELKRRFSDKNIVLLKALQACSQTSTDFLEIKSVEPLITAYNLDYKSLDHELPIAKRTLAGKKLDDISEVFLALKPLQVAFPETLKLLQLVLTIPVSTAKCERTFSTLKRTKTYLRSTMNETRLSNMAILSIERDISSKLDLELVVDNFAKENRRICLQ